MCGWTHLGRWGVAVLLVVGATGCTPDEKPVEHPAGSRSVVVNQPTQVDGVGIVASRLKNGEVSINVISEGQPVASQRMSVGDEATLSGFTFELIAIDEDDSKQPDGQTGGDRTTVWILPK